MSPETIFSVCTRLVLPGWLLRIFAPRWKWTARAVAACVLPLALAAAVVSVELTVRFIIPPAFSRPKLLRLSVLSHSSFIPESR